MIPPGRIAYSVYCENVVKDDVKRNLRTQIMTTTRMGTA
jgi:hypothetical protein